MFVEECLIFVFCFIFLDLCMRTVLWYSVGFKSIAKHVFLYSWNLFCVTLVEQICLGKNYRFELLLEPLASKQSHSIKDSQLYFKVGIRCFTLYAVPIFFFSKHAGCVQGQKVLFTCHLATTYSCRFSGLFSSILFVQTFWTAYWFLNLTVIM